LTTEQIERMKELNVLKNQGILTAEEFEQQKGEIMAEKHDVTKAAEQKAAAAQAATTSSTQVQNSNTASGGNATGGSNTNQIGNSGNITINVGVPEAKKETKPKRTGFSAKYLDGPWTCHAEWCCEPGKGKFTIVSQNEDAFVTYDHDDCDDVQETAHTFTRNGLGNNFKCEGGDPAWSTVSFSDENALTWADGTVSNKITPTIYMKELNKQIEQPSPEDMDR